MGDATKPGVYDEALKWLVRPSLSAVSSTFSRLKQPCTPNVVLQSPSEFAVPVLAAPEIRANGYCKPTKASLSTETTHHL